MSNMCVLPKIPDNTASVLGIGTDICAIRRIEHIYHRFQDSFLKRIFSDAECQKFYTLPDVKKMPFLAKRFATKEAVAKALHTGIGQYVHFTDISCLSKQNKPPYIILTGITHETALRLAKLNHYGTYYMHISISDDTDYATAFTVFTGVK
jgi:holo-[acyl-carrier protein] synthase